MGLSIGLNTALLALRAHQLAVDTASHNIANAQTPGFSRQRVLMRALVYPPTSPPSGLLSNPGVGVDASHLHRVRDTFLDYQVRQALGSYSSSSALAQALGRAEITFGEPSETALGGQMGAFWSALHDVVNDPQSMPARSTLLNTASNMASRFQLMRGSLVAQRQDLDVRISAMANEINAAANGIAELNVQIAQFEAGGEMANDLRDQRDMLLDDLSKLGPITYQEQPDKTVTVSWGSHQLVQGNTASAVSTEPHPGQPGMNRLIFTSDNAVLDTSAGKLGGMTTARDTALPGLISKLDELASGLITAVNAVHSAGYGLDGSTGNAFFTGTDASDIAVNAALIANPAQFAAAGVAGALGNADNVLALADLQLGNTMSGGTQSFDAFYASLVSVLGSDTKAAQDAAGTAELVLGHVELQRQSVSGVNIDEEVTNMAMAQHAYSASARVITTIDEMLDTLINRTGNW